MKNFLIVVSCFFSVLYADQVTDLKQKVLNELPNWWGWCPLKKAEYLIDLVMDTKPKVCVEIGVYGGRSLFPIASALKLLNSGIAIGIDPWKKAECVKYFDPSVDKDDLEWWTRQSLDLVYHYLIDKIERSDLRDQIQLIRCTSEQAQPIYDIDLLHIDGNHSDYASYLDVTKWVPLVNSGGRIIFDDTDIPTTARAVEWLDQNCMRLAEYRDDGVWGVWIKP